MGEDNPTEPKLEKGFKGYSLTPSERKGRARVDLTGWRKQVQTSKLKFDDRQKGIYLNVLKKTGMKNKAAAAAGVHVATVLTHKNDDPEFSDACDDALGYYRDHIVHHAYVVAVKGVKEPIFGGKDKDEHVGDKIVYATNILAMEMRRVEPGYKEKIEHEGLAAGGVMLVPETAKDVEAYLKEEEERTKNKPMPGADEELTK